ncbi:uncharacterized protein LOC108194476 [Daucus carota subsp. sativus]|uniref:uncharacterized protein LOC108194476 n=1 Tax=Daucus carota subsp. sativus TaxID=79200 RepID=UPI0007EF8ED3|nr:PREDICTED: uncharacterized protein LOC108194476 isoform X2 [Daucus carota subsp. sativus]
MGCFKICFGTCKNQKVPTKQLLPALHNDKPTKPVVQVPKSVIFEFSCRNKIDVLADGDNKEKESEIYNLGNQKCTNLVNEKEGNVIRTDNFLDYGLSKLEKTAGLEAQEELNESLNIAKIGDLLQVSSDKQVNGLYNVRQLLQERSSDSLYSASAGNSNGLDDVLAQEESSESLFSVSLGSKKKVNAAETDDDVREESSDSLFSVSVESRKQFNCVDNVDQLVQEETSDSLFSVSVGSRKKVKTAENGEVLVHEESSDSVFSVSVESRQQFNGLDNVDQEESSDSLFSVSVGSKKKVNIAENGDVLDQEVSSGLLISASIESREQQNDFDNVDQLVQQESSDSLSVSVGSDKKVNAAENGKFFVQEEPLGSQFSASSESRKQVNAVETDENEVTSPISLEVKHICKHDNLSPVFANSVLGPIENLTNWKKGIKVKTDNSCVELKESEKENLIPFSVEEPSLNKTIPKQQKRSHLKAGGSPVSVDTSLSNWLIKSDGGSSENTPMLAAFTCEELKQHSPALSPRIGTAGSYGSNAEKIKNSSDSNCLMVEFQQTYKGQYI